MGLSKKYLQKYNDLHTKLLNMNNQQWPMYAGDLANLLQVNINTIKNLSKHFSDMKFFLGDEETQKNLLRKHQSDIAKIREASYSNEYKKKKAMNLSLKAKEQYEKLTPEEKASYRQTRFLKNWSQEKEEQRRSKIKQTENARDKDTWDAISNKRKNKMLSKSPEELRAIYDKQGQSLKNTLANLTPEEKLQRNLKTGQGRKKRYLTETAEDKLKRSNKISKTCLERYGCAWYTLSNKFVRNYKMHSKVNIKVSEKLTKLGINFEEEYRIDNYSYDFRINNYLIEINPYITHNIDWSPFGDHKNVLAEDYHKRKSIIAINNGFKCLHIFDWINLFDYIDSILNNDIVLIPEENPIYYWDSVNKCLVEESVYLENKPDEGTCPSIFKIIGDGYKICQK